MPTISAFYGIIIRMHWADHGPPHFHAIYGGDEATIAIQTLALLRGELPRRVLALTLEWATLHQGELLENWDLCAKRQAPNRIAPLE